MTAFGELQQSMQTMGFAQLVCAFAALIGHSLAQSRLVESRLRLFALALALGGAAGFVATTRPWEHGAILLVFGLALLGLLTGLVWALSLALRLATNRPAAAADSALSTIPGDTSPRPRPDKPVRPAGWLHALKRRA